MVVAARLCLRVGAGVAVTTRPLAAGLLALLPAVIQGAEVPDAATPAGAAGPPDAAADPGAPKLVPPVALTPTEVEAPDGAWGPVTVEVIIQVDATGEVTQVRRSKSTPPTRFSDAFMVAATHFAFEPATAGGEPVPVEVTFRQTFLPPPKEAGGGATACQARLGGTIVEKGTGRAIPRATIVVDNEGDVFQTKSDAGGRFELSVPAGTCSVDVFSTGHRRFRVHEKLVHREQLEVRYLVERSEYGAYEAVVIGKQDQDVVARTTLRAREIKQVPGSFGDPYRVVTTLPGVASIMSLVSYPIVRGSSPGNTAYLLDGVEMPQLFHLLAGPAVVHPQFVDHIDFYPGTFPVRYGGYTGGIVSGSSRRPAPDEATIEANADLTRAGLFVRMPFEKPGISTTAAFQYGYPALLLSILSPEASIGYWDYQLRADASPGPGRFKAFLFGSRDVIKSQDESGREQTDLAVQFHKLDLSYRVDYDGGSLSFHLAPGYDKTQLGEDLTVTSWLLRPRVTVQHELGERLSFQGGLEGVGRRSRLGEEILDESAPLTIDRDNIGFIFLQGGAYASLTWQPWQGFFVIPGVRGDVYYVNPNDDLTAVMNRDASGEDPEFVETTEWSWDPRLLWRYRAIKAAGGDIWVKGGTGLYHQPPRFMFPMPGLVGMNLKSGLLESWQSTIGVEAPLFGVTTLDVQLYYQQTDPIFLDFEINEDPFAPAGEEDGFADRTEGRAYGLELLLKHRGNDRLYGWLSYSLSRAMRRLPTETGRQWLPYDFDITHSAHLVAGIRLPDNWQVAARMQALTGRPVNTIQGGRNSGRLPGFFRLDLRVDKRVIYDEWMLDFYIDVINATLARETVDTVSDGFRYVLPTVGFRAVL